MHSDSANEEHLRWMIQKDSLGQDIFLLGPFGDMDLRLSTTRLDLADYAQIFVSCKALRFSNPDV